MTKPYNEMSAAERLADRIAKNREIDQRDKRKPECREVRHRRCAANRKAPRMLLRSSNG